MDLLFPHVFQASLALKCFQHFLTITFTTKIVFLYKASRHPLQQTYKVAIERLYTVTTRISEEHLEASSTGIAVSLAITAI